MAGTEADATGIGTIDEVAGASFSRAWIAAVMITGESVEASVVGVAGIEINGDDDRDCRLFDGKGGSSKNGESSSRL